MPLARNRQFLPLDRVAPCRWHGGRPVCHPDESAADRGQSMHFSRSFSWNWFILCLLLAGCAGRGYGPTSLRGSPPIYMGQPPVYSPVTSPTGPTGPVPGKPGTPQQPAGPSAGQPSDLDLSLQPTLLQSTFLRGSGQFATLGQTIDGRMAPLGISRVMTPNKVALSPDSVAGQRSRDRLKQAALVNGLPSSPQEDLRHRGGKIIKDLTYVNIFVGGPSRWNASDRQWIDYALEAGMTDPNLNHVIMQYFDGQPVTADFRGSFWMSGYQPQRVTQANLKQITSLLYKQGSFNGLPLDSTIISYFLPSGVILEDPDVGNQMYSGLSRTIPAETEASSADGLGGYHGSVRIDSRTTVYFSVMAYSERRPNGGTNGIPAYAESWKSITATAYHELQEARTDPDVDDAIQTGQERYLGWTSDRGQEIADFPVEAAQQLSQVFTEVTLTDGSDKVPVQLLYSNAVHGPEGPIAKPYSGNPLPSAKRKTPRPGGSTPTPSEPSGNSDQWLQYIDSEWSRLPESVKAQVIRLIQQAANQPATGL